MKLPVNFPALVRLAHFAKQGEWGDTGAPLFEIDRIVTMRQEESGWGLEGYDFDGGSRHGGLEEWIGPEGVARIWGGLSVRSTSAQQVEDMDGEGVAFTLFTGVYEEGMPAVREVGEASFEDWHSERNASRRGYMKGVIAGTLGVERLLESIFGGRALGVAVALYSGGMAEGNRLTRLGEPALEVGRLGRVKELRWYSDRWNMVVVPNVRFFEGSLWMRPWLVLVSGFLLSGTLAGLVGVQYKGRAAAEAWGRDLEVARGELQLVTREREVFQRNLHDGVLQSLYASVLGLRRARRALFVDREKAADLIEGVVNEVEEGMETIRGYLRAGVAEEVVAATLAGRLRGYVMACNRIGGAVVKLEGELAVLSRLSDQVATQVFYVVREAVSNAKRHRNAGEVRVWTGLEGDGVEVSVVDGGCGFDLGAVVGAGEGLRSMRERVDECGGRLEVRSVEGGGTEVWLRVRLSGEVEQ